MKQAVWEDEVPIRGEHSQVEVAQNVFGARFRRAKYTCGVIIKLLWPEIIAEAPVKAPVPSCAGRANAERARE
jgi:hypothetical protein